MLLGDELINIDHLIQLIETSSKINHNLVKTDVLQKDRQNYASCAKISNRFAIDALISVPNSCATQVYLEVCLFTSSKTYKNLTYNFF